MDVARVNLADVADLVDLAAVGPGIGQKHQAKSRGWLF